MDHARLQRQAMTQTRRWPDFGVSGSLPADVMRNASQRLVALAMVTALIAGFALFTLLWGSALGVYASGALRLASILAISLVLVVSAATGLAALLVRMDATQVFWTGLGFLLTVVFVGALVRYATSSQPTGGYSAVSLLMALFPVFVPCSPRKALLAEGLALFVALLAYAITLLLGATLLTPFETIRAFQGELLAVVLGVIASDVVYGLGSKLEKARQLGAYELIEPLGQGGMGEVWRARHAMLARPAAVKLIRSEALAHSNEGGRAALVTRFEREAQSAASLSSPHTIEIYDFGVADDGTFYYVMELLHGIDLHDLVARHGAISAERVVHILRQACRSLSEAHRQGLVHRDIKPSNLILCRVGDEVDFVKVLDFGLVTPPMAGPGDGRLTVQGSITGTPAFMSPEQAKGNIQLDGRSDLYALGCVAYWLLTGALIFDAPSQMDMVVRHIRDAPTAPSERSILPIPKALDALILRLLAKDPAERPATAAELLDLLATIPLDAEWTEARARMWWQNNFGESFDTRVRTGQSEETLPLPSS